MYSGVATLSKKWRIIHFHNNIVSDGHRRFYKGSVLTSYCVSTAALDATVVSRHAWALGEIYWKKNVRRAKAECGDGQGTDAEPRPV